ncbi:MAG: peptide deformylase [Puniceicoccales bacterium]|nr:peptide deformylase [Puniceicoccales bacterium]
MGNWKNCAIKEVGNSAGERFLRALCAPMEWDPKFDYPGLAAAMEGKMVQAGGVGLAAPQVGILQRFFVIALAACMEHSSGATLDGRDLYPIAESTPGAIFCMNPKIVSLSNKTQTGSEGCLSIPRRHEVVTRPAQVELTFLGVDGAGHVLRANGLLARCCCHEFDHLNGRLFIDYL